MSLDYEEDSKIFACFKLQSEVFQAQFDICKQMQSYVKSECVTKLPEESKEHNYDIRVLEDRAKRGAEKRLVNDVEMTILGILDHEGKLSVASRLNDFVVLMTRATKVDQRVMCCHILANNTSTQCLSKFVNLGGLRLLRRWSINAMQQDQVDEMICCLLVCKSLYVSAAEMKRSGITGAIKKMSRYSSSSGRSVDELHTVANELMSIWSKNAKEISAAEAEVAESKASAIVLPATLPKIVSAMSSLLVDLRGVAVPEVVEEDVVVESEDVVVDDVASAITEGAMEVVEVADEELVMRPTKAPRTRAYPTMPTGNTAAIPALPSSLTNLMHKSTSGSKSWGSLSSGTVGEVDGVLDNVPVSKKMSQVLSSSHSSAGNSNGSSSHSKNVYTPRFVPPPKDTLPGPGGLKRKRNADSDASQEEEIKPTRKSVSFKDYATNTSIKEVLYFSCGRDFKRSIAKYKNVKEGEKLAKKQEKIIRQKKIQVSLQNDIEWSRPMPISLPADILEVRTSMELCSDASDTEATRLTKVFESKYSEEAYIPDDPAGPPSVYQASSLTPTAPGRGGALGATTQFSAGGPVAVAIDWNIPGLLPPSSSVLASGSMESSDDQAVVVDDDDEDDANMMEELMAMLPPSLLTLDPKLLQELVQDETKLLSISNDDGTIDEEKLHQLLNEASSSAGEHKRRASRFSEATEHPVVNPGYVDYSAPTSSPVKQHTSSPWNMDSSDGGFSMETLPSRTKRVDMPSGYTPATAPALAPRILPPYSVNAYSSHTSSTSQPARASATAFPTTKSNTPCRFFNTASGCSRGNVCEFGHFPKEIASQKAASLNTNRYRS